MKIFFSNFLPIIDLEPLQSLSDELVNLVISHVVYIKHFFVSKIPTFDDHFLFFDNAWFWNDRISHQAVI